MYKAQSTGGSISFKIKQEQTQKLLAKKWKNAKLDKNEPLQISALEQPQLQKVSAFIHNPDLLSLRTTHIPPPIHMQHILFYKTTAHYYYSLLLPQLETGLIPSCWNFVGQDCCRSIPHSVRTDRKVTGQFTCFTAIDPHNSQTLMKRTQEEMQKKKKNLFYFPLWRGGLAGCCVYDYMNSAQTQWWMPVVILCLLGVENGTQAKADIKHLNKIIQPGRDDTE